MHANTRQEIDKVYSGDIAAAVGLKDTTTGDTLCALDAPVILESIEFPDPVIQVAVEPKSKADQDKMGVALQKLAEEDPSFRVETNVETGETVISGMGELHLDVLVDRMKREFKVEANVGAPQVSYRETFRAATKAEGKLFVSLVVKDNTVTYGLNLHQMKKVKALSLKTQLSVVWFLVNTSQQLKKG